LNKISRLSGEEREAFIRTLDKPTLLALLESVEKRLGTEDEGPKDFEHCHVIAHQLRNIATAESIDRWLEDT
jgi:hypothetical protein